MSFLFKDRDGQTPLPAELRKGLRPKNITTMGELDEYEELNIAKGLVWLMKQDASKCLDRYFWLQLHKRLFGEVWSWAGQIRDHELNNPDFCLPHTIQIELKELEDSLAYWVDHDTYESKELLAVVHVKLLTIHPFNNGNGRFSRIFCEKLANLVGDTHPSWGSDLAKKPKARRDTYISAIMEARHRMDTRSLQDFMYS